MFHSGQKVICIDAVDAPQLSEGGVYTVLRLDTPVWGIWRDKEYFMPGVYLIECDCDPTCFGFSPYRFRPACERKTDISVFTRLLNKQPEPA